jgi:methionyl-tRNA formyltransferase
MRIVFFGNGPVALDALRWLKAQGEEIVGLVTLARDSWRNGEELIAESGLPPDRLFEGPALREPATVRAIAGIGAEAGLSVLFSHILRPPLLAVFPKGMLNVHPSYLPYNQGRSAQVWGIVEGTPVGASLHYMNEGVDTGPIVHRVPVAIDPADTGQSLRAKLNEACGRVLREAWPAVAAGTAQAMAQDPGEGTSHRIADLESIQRIDLDRTYTGRELIDLLRALTSPPQSDGAYFEVDGRRIRVTVRLDDEKDEKKSPSG